MRLMPLSSSYAVLRKAGTAWMAAVCSTVALAQVAATDPDWKEDIAPPAPAFEINRLVPFEVSASASLRWGIDPQTITIGKDDIVRYVVIAQSPSGVVNAMYEAIRCATSEWKTYARFNQDSGWVNVGDPKWQALNSGPSPHAARLARQGVCTGTTRAGSVREILQILRQPVQGARRDAGKLY
jgi:CNP1-like family